MVDTMFSFDSPPETSRCISEILQKIIGLVLTSVKMSFQPDWCVRQENLEAGIYFFKVLNPQPALAGPWSCRVQYTDSTVLGLCQQYIV